MQHKHTSFAFLMEMLWVCGFFILAACIFLLVFVKADHMSRGASNLNQAVLAAENAVEDVFAEYSGAEAEAGEEQLYFDRSWNPLANGEGAEFFITVQTGFSDGFLHVTATAAARNGAEIYKLEGGRFIPAD